MYDFTGCQCVVCHRPFQSGEDLVVCPDCGAPYHRACYEQQGRCVFAAKHGPDFEWQPPQPKAVQETACRRCGAMNEVENAYCKSCGAPLKIPAPGSRGPAASAAGGQAGHTAPSGNAASAQAGAAAQQQAGQAFDYEQFYRSPYAGTQFTPSIDPNEMLNGIPAAEWVSYLGPSSRAYLNVFKRMEVMQRRVVVSFSAFLFGPYYFFYRKAWKPAAICLAISLLLNVPLYLWEMQVTGSPIAAGLNLNVLTVLVYLSMALAMVFRLLCGLYGFYVYRQDSTSRIQHIRQQVPDPEKRAFVLSAQGGTSILSVLLAFVVVLVVSEGVSMLLGPNVDALYTLLGL